jgi:hypothetical protein
MKEYNEDKLIQLKLKGNSCHNCDWHALSFEHNKIICRLEGMNGIELPESKICPWWSYAYWMEIF